MDRIKLGTFEVAKVGLGCSNFGWICDARQAADIIGAAIDLGIDYFDTADVYPPSDPGRSEIMLAAALGKRRGAVSIGSKFGFDIGAPGGKADAAHIRASLEGSLRRLNTDRLELFQLHRPSLDTPIGETLATLGDCISEGKLRAIGLSNFNAEQLRQALDSADQLGVTIASVQNEYSALRPSLGEQVLPLCGAQLRLIPYFVLASGLLTGKYRAAAPYPRGTRLERPERWAYMFIPDDHIGAVEALIDFAESRGHSVLELALAWNNRREIGPVLVGTTSIAQLQAVIEAWDRWTLSDAERSAIAELVALHGASSKAPSVSAADAHADIVRASRAVAGEEPSRAD